MHLLYFSEDEALPSELPKQTFIKNGLRSNYYKTSPVGETKSTRFVGYICFSRKTKI